MQMTHTHTDSDLRLEKDDSNGSVGELGQQDGSRVGDRGVRVAGSLAIEHCTLAGKDGHRGSHCQGQQTTQ